MLSAKPNNAAMAAPKAAVTPKAAAAPQPVIAVEAAIAALPKLNIANSSAFIPCIPVDPVINVSAIPETVVAKPKPVKFTDSLKEKLVDINFIDSLAKYFPENYFTLSAEVRLEQLKSVRTNEEFFDLLVKYKAEAVKFLKICVDDKSELIKELKRNRLGQYFLMSVEERIDMRLFGSLLPVSLFLFLSKDYYELSKEQRCEELLALREDSEFVKLLMSDRKNAKIFMIESVENDPVLLRRLLSTVRLGMILSDTRLKDVGQALFAIKFVKAVAKAVAQHDHHHHHHHHQYSPSK